MREHSQFTSSSYLVFFIPLRPFGLFFARSTEILQTPPIKPIQIHINLSVVHHPSVKLYNQKSQICCLHYYFRPSSIPFVIKDQFYLNSGLIFYWEVEKLTNILLCIKCIGQISEKDSLRIFSFSYNLFQDQSFRMHIGCFWDYNTCFIPFREHKKIRELK